MSYACKNRGEFAPSIQVADGWENSWARRMVDMEFRMDPSCIYSTSELGQKDEQCHGCRWKASPGAGVAAGPVQVGDSLAGVREMEGEPSGSTGAGDVERASAVAEQRSALEQAWPTAALYQPTEEK